MLQRRLMQRAFAAGALLGFVVGYLLHLVITLFR